MNDNFAVFILSHARANNVKTIEALKKSNYSGKYYIIIDDKDPQIDEYKRLYNDRLIIFSKSEMLGSFDTMNNFNNMNVVVFARNKCFSIAKQLKLKYFLELDDDYRSFIHREQHGMSLKTVYVGDLDSVINEYIEFLDTSNALTVCFAQTGDFIGGVRTTGPVWRDKVARKAMNAFFCRVDRPFKFIGMLNEDVNTYVSLGKTGNLFLTPVDINIGPQETQTDPGGLTESYLFYGTYVKSYYSLMTAPSCVKIGDMGSFNKRIHHFIDWDKAVPVIISDRFKKTRQGDIK